MIIYRHWSIFTFRPVEVFSQPKVGEKRCGRTDTQKHLYVDENIGSEVLKQLFLFFEIEIEIEIVFESNHK